MANISRMVFVALVISLAGLHVHADPYRNAIKNDDPEKIGKLILKDKVNINSLDKEGFALIHRAASADSARVIVELNRLGANLDLRAEDKKTAVMIAFEGRKRASMQALLANGASLNMRDIYEHYFNMSVNFTRHQAKRRMTDDEQEKFLARCLQQIAFSDLKSIYPYYFSEMRLFSILDSFLNNQSLKDVAEKFMLAFVQEGHFEGVPTLEAVQTMVAVMDRLPSRAMLLTELLLSLSKSVEWSNKPTTITDYGTNVDLLSMSAKDIAMAITLRDSQLFRLLQKGELFLGAKDRRNSAVLIKLVNNFNLTSNYFAYSLIDAPNDLERAKILVHLSKIVHHFKGHNNFNGQSMVAATLTMEPVHRLLHDFQLDETLTENANVFSPQNHYSEYTNRLAHGDSEKPAVPALNILLATIEQVTSLENYCNDGYSINRSKIAQLSTLLNAIANFQKHAYDFKVNEKVLATFSKMHPMRADLLRARSLYRQKSKKLRSLLASNLDLNNLDKWGVEEMLAWFTQADLMELYQQLLKVNVVTGADLVRFAKNEQRTLLELVQKCQGAEDKAGQLLRILAL